MQMRSAAGQHTLKLQHKCQQHNNQPRPEAESLYRPTYHLAHSYRKENRREHSRRFARLDFCISYNWRCHEISQYKAITEFLRRYIIVGHFRILHIPSINRLRLRLPYLAGQLGDSDVNCWRCKMRNGKCRKLMREAAGKMRTYFKFQPMLCHNAIVHKIAIIDSVFHRHCDGPLIKVAIQFSVCYRFDTHMLMWWHFH